MTKDAIRAWLDPTHIGWGVERAVAALADGDPGGMLILASNVHSIDIVYRNHGLLTSLGLLEKAVVDAFMSTRLNNHHDYPALRALVRRCDRQRLREAGDPLPGTAPWTLYRGIAGRGRARRVRGYSWTLDPERAQWFADRGLQFGLESPAVVRAIVPTRNVLFYTNKRTEQEFVVDLPSGHPVQRVEALADELRKAGEG